MEGDFCRRAKCISRSHKGTEMNCRKVTRSRGLPLPPCLRGFVRASNGMVMAESSWTGAKYQTGTKLVSDLLARLVFASREEKQIAGPVSGGRGTCRSPTICENGRRTDF